MLKITVNGELLFELESQQAWINRVPRILPPKRPGEQWIWVDKRGNIFECGADFMAAEKDETYPCKVYRLQTVAGFSKSKQIGKTKYKLQIKVKGEWVDDIEFKSIAKLVRYANDYHRYKLSYNRIKYHLKRYREHQFDRKNGDWQARVFAIS